MKTIAIIPARLSASRFPRKPLAPLLGRPMIEHVYQRTKLCRMIDEVYIATCDREIFAAAQHFGGKAIMTSSSHERASDRVAEAAKNIPCDVVVMVQGDEPMIRPEMIESAVDPMRRDPAVLCTNLAAPIRSEEEFTDRNTIKVVGGLNGDALYFSREAIPARGQLLFSNLPIYKQVCVIPFRREFLMRYAALTPTPLERAESIDMLRALEHGFPIRLVRTDVPTHAVDTPRDLQVVEDLMRIDPLAGRRGESGGRS
ncbi:MAG: 3-deoxy-manno-octulosonate cytidylyltransferase [Proteobacteria bacterium]|nr:3-deoxy-manno-octulosonate cytidylyltransferase [Pseudomonadota bacterium]